MANVTGKPAHRARKRFGQNFLHDQQVIHRIIQSIVPKPRQTMVEIGPGLGALTVPLLKIMGALTVIELDRDVIPTLEKQCEGLGKLEIIEADVLKVDFTQFPSSISGEGLGVRVVGNLPYNISTPLLFHLMKFHQDIQDMHFMLQKEVVQRLAAKPNTKAYGRLSVMMQLYCEVEPLFTVSPASFSPQPKVDSMIVRLTPKPDFAYTQAQVEKLSYIVQLAFSHRRKTIANNLKSIMSASQLQTGHIDPGSRAENLSLDDFIRIMNEMR